MDEPIRVYNYANGNIKMETWMIKGRYHRIEKPAYIIYNDCIEHTVRQERWFVNDVLHRVDGPANVFYDAHGNVSFGMWYIHGIKLANYETYNWLIENNISVPYTDEDIMAIKLRWE